MMKTNRTKRWSRSLSIALVLSMLIGMITVPTAHASDFGASSIQKLDNISSNFMDYLDSSVMFRLPEGIEDDEDISVIVTVDTVSVMDAYEKSDKTMSLSEYASSSDYAFEAKEQVAAQKASLVETLKQVKIILLFSVVLSLL